ncbi:hypothetical protein WDL1P2_00509 (plasmid) [Variovorax sp. WDL1]|nr:hypothetical protein APY03_7490 [Variovorax sp. WDL1]PNG49094.1 hypothetical protein CHC06_06331 [Variovorax sp. B2]PNG49479.1 hypothetical protein CHC07_06388 [Variovorax sp. B4]VTV18890.1 hypothetical protein WDL1P2_00509 [Variovorax sp. WDL1]
MLAQAPVSAGPDYAEWLTIWCQSGARNEGDAQAQPFHFMLRKDRAPRDLLDEDNLLPMRRMLSHHPGAPMAYAEICRQASGFMRLRSLVEYLKVQSEQPSVTNASDQGSSTAYVSPLHVNEVMRGFHIEDSDEAEQEIARMRAIAREQVMRDLLEIAGSASEHAFNAAANTWLRKEYTRRQAAEKPPRIGGSASAASSATGVSSERGQDQAIALPSERPSRLAFRAGPPVGQQPTEAIKTAPATDKPLSFGFRRPAG